MIKNKQRIIIFSIMCALAIAAGGAAWLLLYRDAGPPIIEFDIKRDGKAIIESFERDWEWLIPGDRDSFSPELMLAYRAPQQNPLYAGRMNIKVMRDGDKLIGFVTWYMKDVHTGFLNFVDVNPEYRGKGYAEKLVKNAMDAMIADGAQKLTMVTWPYNTRARGVYDRLGWHVVKTDNQVHYEYITP